MSSKNNKNNRIKLNYNELNRYNDEFLVVSIKTIKLCSKLIRDNLNKEDNNDLQSKLESLETNEGIFIKKMLNKYTSKKEK